MSDEAVRKLEQSVPSRLDELLAVLTRMAVAMETVAADPDPHVQAAPLPTAEPVIATYSPEQVASQFGIDPSFVRKKTRLGEWPHHTIGRRIRFTAADVKRIEKLTQTEPIVWTGGISRERLIANGLTPQSAARQRANTMRPAAATDARTPHRS